MKITLDAVHGDDLMVVNAAKASFGKKSEWEAVTVVSEEYDVAHGYTPVVEIIGKRLSDKDRGLIEFLARGCRSGEWDKLIDNVIENSVQAHSYGGHWDAAFIMEVEDIVRHVKQMPTHWTPFGHPQVSVWMEVPIFILRQWMRSEEGRVISETSRRYVDDKPTFYMPEVWRKRAADVKQGSSDEAMDLHASYVFGDEPKHGWDDYTVGELLSEHYERVELLYQRMIEIGVCPEQARMILPQSMYTSVYITGSLYYWANVYKQRVDPHAQKEIRDLAYQLDPIMEKHFPVSWEALKRW